MIRIIIAEDDRKCADQLERYVEKFGHETGQSFQISHYDNGEDLVAQYKPEYDLILLDIEMPFINGMEAAAYIRQIDPKVVIVFVTNSAQYAIQGYSVKAMDYILKPINYFSFSQRLGQALQYVRKHEDTYITVAKKGGSIRLQVSGIYYVEHLGRKLVIHTRAGIYESTATLQQVEDALCGQGFARCNKGYLVNLEYVDGIRDSCAVVRGDKLLISRGRRSTFLEALAKHMGGIEI